MDAVLISPAQTTVLGLPAAVLYTIIPAVGIGVFGYMIYMRLKPLLKAAPDNRAGNLSARARQLLKIWLFQRRHPRYLAAGILHIPLFAGFLILGLRSLEMMFLGIIPGFSMPGLGGVLGMAYGVLRTYAATWVLIVALAAMVRRGIVQPARYTVPAKYGKAHTAEAVFVLGLICTLVISESLFEGSQVAAQLQMGLHTEYLPPLTLA